MNVENKVWDVAIIGAGAAGLMTAVMCARQGLKVSLFDSQPKIGAKILMSGGTRCNVTNESVTDKDFESENLRLVRHVLQAFPAAKAAEFFREIGVDLVLEDQGKYFPVTHSGKTVLDAFIREIKRLGICLKHPCKVRNVEPAGAVFKISGSGFEERAQTVVLTTGGLSFPTSGSDGSGYGLAEKFGHRLIPTSPSLTPLKTDDEDWKKLSGMALPVSMMFFYRSGKKTAEYTGDFLFTHVGFSGPVVLNISRHWIRGGDAAGRRIVINFLPAVAEEVFRKDLLGRAGVKPPIGLRRFLAGCGLPARFAEAVMHKSEINPDIFLNDLQKEKRETLIKHLFAHPLSVTGDMGYAKAEVTAGGVDLAEINTATMESKRMPGLFFAGEILDVDGRIGGFNFQWAWSSGFTAALGIAKKIKGTSVNF